MATPRSLLIDSENIQYYHLVSRCVRRSWFCGTDPVSGRNFDHRRNWLEDRILQLASCFAVDIYAYAIMSNHFHLIVRYDPNAASQWLDQEVADRWFAATGHKDDELEPDRDTFLGSPIRVTRARETLGSLSLFMKHLKQPIAWRANREDGCTGHFFEGRFYSGLLLSEDAVVAAMAYVDLNPVRAKIVEHAIDAQHTSAARRFGHLENTQARLEEYIGPIVCGTAPHSDKADKPITLDLTVEGYLNYLALYSSDSANELDRQTRWRQRLAVFKHRQRAFGTLEEIQRWVIRKGWSRIGVVLS